MKGREAGMCGTHRCQRVDLLNKSVQERLALVVLRLPLNSLSVQFGFKSLVVSAELGLARRKSAVDSGDSLIDAIVDVGSFPKETWAKVGLDPGYCVVETAVEIGSFSKDTWKQATHIISMHSGSG